MTRNIKEHLSLLLIDDPVWPSYFNEKDWEIYFELCITHKLENLFYYRIKNSIPVNFPYSLKKRLENIFYISFSHFSRIKNEIKNVHSALLNRHIPFMYIKGYPLAMNYYPHIATRIFEDIDVVIEYSKLESIKEIFIQNQYSILPPQSKIEKKINFIKLNGPYVYAFELHRFLHTTYQTEDSSLSRMKLDKNGMPDSETLFLSVLLHHKFFESSLRDLFDLNFILKSNPDLDWELIINFCKKEKLYMHFLIMKELSQLICKKTWLKLQNENLSFVYSIIKKLMVILKYKYALWLTPKRTFFMKICDALIIFLVYDDPVFGLKSFFNKYIRFVFFKKYLRFIIKRV